MSGDYRFFDLAPVRVDMREEVLAGLRAPIKTIAPKYFYDEHGSQLFDAITHLPEYYPTRTETSLYEAHSKEIGEHFKGDVTLVEYGSGSSRKIRALLEGVRPAAYVPLDISSEHLETSAKALQADYEWLDIYAVCADYSGPFELPSEIPAKQVMAFFPGSSIGNFTPADAQEFLRRVRLVIGANGKLLIGIDRKKSPAEIEAAYNDAQGITAAFNLNVLEHLNRELAGDFDTNNFRHVANYNTKLGSLQMFLEAKRGHSVQLAGEMIEFAEGEQIHTENSFKYTPEEFVAMAQGAGFAEEWHITDNGDKFSVFLLAATSAV